MYMQSKIIMLQSAFRSRLTAFSLSDWPTLTTLVPRAALSLLLLVSFTSANPRDSTATASRRDFAYFRPDGTLSTYNLVCNLM